MDHKEKVRENRLRRMAERRGLRLEKCRRRDPYALGYRRYWLIDTFGGSVIYGAGPWGGPGATIDEIEAFLESGKGVGE